MAETPEKIAPDLHGLAAKVPAFILRDRALAGGENEWSGGHPLGAHASWKWDGSSLEAAVDALGLFPLFYYNGGGNFGISPSILPLAEEFKPLDLDYDALGVFLRLGYFLSGDTPFRQIRAATPGMRLRFDAGGLTVSQASTDWGPPHTCSRDAAVRQYGRLFSRAIDRRLPDGPFAVPLSGGRDSRHIFLELLRAGVRPLCAVTMDSQIGRDWEVAAALAKQAGVRHAKAEPTTFSLAAARQRNIDTSLCSDEHLWAGKLRDQLRREGASTLYDGLGGDVLSQSKNLTPERLAWMRSGRLREFAASLMEPEDALLRAILSPEFYARVPLKPAIERVAQEMAAHQHQPNPVGAFYFWHRMRREVALVPFMVMSGFTAHVPFVDQDLYEFLRALPAEFLLDGRLHDETIAAEFPEYAAVGYADRKHQPPLQPPPLRAAMAVLGMASGSTRRWLNRSGLATRLMRAAVDPAYGSNLPSLSKMPVYLDQLHGWSRG